MKEVREVQHERGRQRELASALPRTFEEMKIEVASAVAVGCVGLLGAPAMSAAPHTSAFDIGKTVLLAPRTKSSGCRLGANPDRRCSPGAYYNKLTRRVICAPGFRTGDIRNVPAAEKFGVEREYGLVPRTYGRMLEIDHIVSLELGGSNAIANLFPVGVEPITPFRGLPAPLRARRRAR